MPPLGGGMEITMNQKERMLAGLPYKAWLDGLSEERTSNKIKLLEYNSCIQVTMKNEIS